MIRFQPIVRCLLVFVLITSSGISITSTMADFYISRLNYAIPKYWCDGGDPQRQIHMKSLLEGLGNVHSVPGPSKYEITTFQARIPDIYSNVSSWCLHGSRGKHSFNGSHVASFSDFNDLIGEFGCSLCHLRAIRTAVRDNQPYALIMEDDISFETLPYWTTDLQTIIDSLPAGWDHLMLTVHAWRGPLRSLRREWERRNRPHFLSTAGLARDIGGVLHSTGAYVISRQGMEKILRRFPDGNDSIIPCSIITPKTCFDFTADNCLFSDRDGGAIGHFWNRYVTTPVLLVDSQRVGTQSLRVNGRSDVTKRYHILSYNLVKEWLASHNHSGTVISF